MRRVRGGHDARQLAPVVLRVQVGDLLLGPREGVADEELEAARQPLVELSCSAL